MARRTIAGTGKKMPFNMRTTAALRAKIEKAAGKSGRSLVQEVEYRVEASFVEDGLQELRDELIAAQNRMERALAGITRLLWTVARRTGAVEFADWAAVEGPGDLRYRTTGGLEPHDG